MQSLFNIYKNWTIYKIIENYVKSYKILFLFSLHVTEVFLKHSRLFIKGLFCEKKLTAKSCKLFMEKDSTIDFWLGS